MLYQLVPARSRLYLIYSKPRHRPPVFKEMREDLAQVIGSVAKKYSDQSCQHLNHDILVSEGWAKLVQMMNDGQLERIKCRTEFFKFFKASFNNHVKGLVHRYRFTYKRTGVKPPPRKKPGEPLEAADFQSAKNTEVSIDDPDNHIQIEDVIDESAISSELMRDLPSILLPVETMVLRQLVEPNAEAKYFAALDSYLGKKIGSKLQVRIKTEHLAKGLGLTPSAFKEIHTSLKNKVKEHMSSKDDVSYNKAIAYLEEIFQVTIPNTLEKLLTRRLLTLAARDQHTKVDELVEKALDVVGAKIPKKHSPTTLGCYGVLFQKGNRACKACGLQDSCATETANVGLDAITISPKLLGSKTAMRMPTILARPAEFGSDPDFLTEKDDALYQYLSENFEKTTVQNEIYFRHKEVRTGGSTSGNVSGLLFKIHRLRFSICKPSASLQDELEKSRNAYLIPDDCSYDEAISLINAHAQETYSEKTTTAR